MKRDTVAKLTGLFQRGTVWWLRVMIPLDLRPAYGGRTKIVQSLDTTDRRDADRKGSARRAALLQEFEDKRRELNPQPVAHIGPELAETLAQGIRARLLRWDDALRSEPATAETWLRFAEGFSAAAMSTVRLGGPPAAPALPSPAELEELARRSPLDGLEPRQLRRLAEVNLEAEAAGGAALAARRLSHVVPLADAEARRLGLLIDWKTPEARPLLLACLKAYRAALGAIVQRDEGHDVDTPAEPAKAREKAPKRLRDVFELWKAAKRRKEDAVQACERALSAFESQCGDPPVSKITRTMGNEFRAWLVKQEISSKTAHDRITWVKSLLRFASRDLELIPRQPWEGIDIEHHTESPRRPWTSAELAAFFSLSIFKTYELPKVVDAGGAAAYWIPLLGLYTGARIGELCQLRVEDVVRDDLGSVLRITEEAPGATLKTVASRREVPIHSELVRLGFLEYVEALRKSGETSMWPVMRFRKGRPGANFSQWFSKMRKEVPGGVPDFHSLRHTVRTALTEAGLPESIKDRITGHEVRGSVGTRVYEHPKAEIRRAVESIRYRSVQLRRCCRDAPKLD